jgi:hypothetical protein
MKRKTLVKTAQYWFEGSRNSQKAGDMEMAVMGMENAFNHTENALALAVRIIQGKGNDKDKEFFLSQFPIGDSH